MRQGSNRKLGHDRETRNGDGRVVQGAAWQVGGSNDEIVLRISRHVVYDYDANGSEIDIVHVTDGVVVIEPDSSGCRPTKRVPGIGEGSPRWHAVANLVRTGDTDLCPESSFG